MTTADDPRWAQVLARDPRADGIFWYSVVTTGVYCRPSCPSRRAKPENATLHDTLSDARATGFRPCKRCHPDEPPRDAALIAKACRLIEESDDDQSLTSIATAVSLSPSHFHRLFKRITGLTPRTYLAAHHAKVLRELLCNDGNITAAIHDAGFTASRFYDRSTALLGMTPGRYRAGAPNEELRFAIGASSLGAILVASSEKGVVAILIDDDPDALAKQLQDRFPRAKLIGGDSDYEALVAQIVGFVEAPRLGIDLPLDIRGTAFQQRVWQALQAIPPGSTASYTEIANRLGMPSAIRAVAGACAANAIAVAIPCHRVVRSDGALSGYAWGVERKRALLAREADAAR